MPGPGGPGGGPRGFLTDEEKQNMPKVDKALLTRILSYLKLYRFQFALVFLTILVSAAVGLLPSIITGRISIARPLGAGFHAFAVSIALPGRAGGID